MAWPSLSFKKVENGTIFQPDFSPFDKNNILEFASTGIAVIYGPNGTGKTSLAKVMSSKDGTALECEYDGTAYNKGSEIFHVINDQNNRNIIAGTTKDFLLGSNIRREYELETLISETYSTMKKNLIAELKSRFGISSASSKAITLIDNSKLMALVKDLANAKSKGGKYAIGDYIAIISCLTKRQVTIDSDKLNFLVADYGNTSSLLRKAEALTAPDFSKSTHAAEIEENSVAIDVLNHYKNKTQCVVCDADGINTEDLIEKKTKHRQAVIDSLTEQMRGFIEEILNLQTQNDPFLIKKRILNALDNGDYSQVVELQKEIADYKKAFSELIENLFLDADGTDKITALYKEYNELVSKKPEISEEDFVYIQEIISNSMSKKIAVTRDDSKNLKILLEEKEFLGVDRGELPLSTGEQNFLSLCFEFLKAKNSSQKIIVLDDPISSFDSIYKNKIVFAIVKMLEKKPRIILTHNIDLLRLLQAQYRDSFKLFLLNNTDGENNGFIPLSKAEQGMLINLQELLDTFRHKVYPDISNPEMYLISMIPFLRGYANIIDRQDDYNSLTSLMHGFRNEKVDVAKVYYSLFGEDGKKVLPDTYKVNVDDILAKSVDGISIVNPQKYALLDKTLHHTFTYLFLRLLVEKTLVSKYKIDTEKYNQLGAIISQAFPSDDVTSIRNRVKLTSKKTLINEFNHFEGNLSIFQPAIDITDHSLSKEKADILSFISMVNAS